MKICRDCHLEKPLAEFYPHSQMADGMLNKCKACVKTRVHRYAKEHPDKIRAFEHARANLPHRVTARAKYAKTEAGLAACKRARERYATSEHGKAAIAASQAAWRNRDPTKRAAHIALNNAVHAGKIEKGPCSVCGKTGRIHGHHRDYSKPLEVVWLCALHHRQIHAKKK